MCTEKKNLLEKAILDCEPISGIIVREDNSSFVLYCVYRAPNKSFGWAKIDFEDENGYNYGGLYYATIVPDYEVNSNPKQSVDEIKKSAFMSAVAIPMRYAIGGGDMTKKDVMSDVDEEHKVHAQKYCVITNWWLERMKHNEYQYPRLDFSMYKSVDATFSQGEPLVTSTDKITGEQYGVI
jgi:hypothetical protein